MFGLGAPFIGYTKTCQAAHLVLRLNIFIWGPALFDKKHHPDIFRNRLESLVYIKDWQNMKRIIKLMSKLCIKWGDI